MALRDWSKIEPQNIRSTTAPLQIDQIKEFFENKSLFFIVDYGKSQIKGNMFLTYLANLDLPFEVDLNNASLQEKFDIVKIYMETRNLNNSDVLRLTVAELLLTYKGISVEGLFRNSIFTQDQKTQFIEMNQDIFRKWDQFFSSCLIYLIKSFPDLNDELKVEQQFRVVNDANYVGLNVIQLFGMPGFIEFFFSKQSQEELCYFKPQFEEYMFKGKNLFDYFNCEENTLMLLMTAVLNNSIKPQDLINFVTTQDA